MTEPSPHPNRRWRRWAFAIAAVLMATGYSLAFWENNRESATHAWLLLASQDHPLPLVSGTAIETTAPRGHVF